MQKILFICASAFFLCGCKHEVKKQFEVTGSVKNTDAKMVYLEETPLASSERIVVDSSILGRDGAFRLKANVSEQSLFNLSLKDQPYPFAFVINDAPKISVTADIRDANAYTIEGSPASKALKSFSLVASDKWNTLYLLSHEMDSLKKAGATDSALIAINGKGQAQFSDLKNYVQRFIQNSSNPITSVWALGTYSQFFSADEYQGLLNGMVKKFPQHKGIAAMKEMNDRQLALAKQKAEESQEANWVGKQAPELSLPDVNGNEIKLSSYKGKYVLVDFWASWCLPCRRENPNVVEAYHKYKDKNFTILGVSLDKEKQDWLDAIKKDKLSWAQVSDLQEWQSTAVSTYGVSGIPFNVLIDPGGTVIGQGLRGTELEKKLSEILK